MGMFGNGVRIGMALMREALRLTLQVQVQVRCVATTGCDVAGLGSAMVTGCARLTASATGRTGVAPTSVFGWPEESDPRGKGRGSVVAKGAEGPKSDQRIRAWLGDCIRVGLDLCGCCDVFLILDYGVPPRSAAPLGVWGFD